MAKEFKSSALRKDKLARRRLLIMLLGMNIQTSSASQTHQNPSLADNVRSSGCERTLLGRVAQRSTQKRATTKRVLPLVVASESQKYTLKRMPNTTQ
jgi:hypothetical protein